MRDPKKRAISNACHWLNKCYDLGVTAEEVIAQSAASPIAASRKENEGEKRTPPLNPPKEKRAKQEKAAAAAAACACAREDAESGASARKGRGSVKHPTLKQVEEQAAILGAPPEFAKWWYDEFDHVQHWRHPKDKKPLRNWERVLQMYWKMRDEFDPPKEHEAVKEEFHSTALEELMPWLK